MRLTESLLFLPLAAVLHVGIWAAAPTIMGASATGGPGQAQATLTAASAQHVALADAWQTPPQTAPAPDLPDVAIALGPLPKPSAPQPGPSLPPVPSLSALLPAALPQTVLQPPRNIPVIPPASPAPQLRPVDTAPPRAPQITTDRAVQTPRPSRPVALRPDAQVLADTSPPATPPQPRPPPKPAQKPTAKPAQTKPPSAPSQRTSGGGKAKRPQTGRSGKDATQSTNAATRNAVRANWGAKIQGKVLRRLIYPRNATGSGVARIALTIDRGGRLTGLQLSKSSGVAAFDQAALSAVRRAGRFPKAPRALTDPTYTFSMSLTFKP